MNSNENTTQRAAIVSPNTIVDVVGGVHGGARGFVVDGVPSMIDGSITVALFGGRTVVVPSFRVVLPGEDA